MSAAAPAPFASQPVVEQYARELVRKGGTTRVLALRASPNWTGPSQLNVGEQRVLVRGCGSSLAVREALLEREPDDWLVILTDRPSDDLGLTLLARMLHQQVEPIDVWHTVPGLFEARAVAPELRALGPWVAAALVEHRPVSGYPVAPAGVVTRDHALRVLTAAVTGLRDDQLDTAGLMAWTADPAAREVWRAQPEPLRAGIVAWAADSMGPVAEVAFRVAGSEGTVDAVIIGLAADVLWPTSGTADETIIGARTRLEPYVGGQPLNPGAARALANTAQGVLLRGGADDGGLRGGLLQRSMLLTRAEALLGDLGWSAGAARSSLLPSGYESRLLALASSLSGGGDVEGALSELLAHEMSGVERADATSRAQMAVRLHRWLASIDEPATDIQQALLRQARDDAWVDRAAADVWVGSTVAPVAEAYAQVVARVAERRTMHDRELAVLLAEATARDLFPEHLIPLENLVTRVVLPIAGVTGVLLLVVDGMSTAVAAELTDGARQRGWVECVPATDLRRTAALAVLPTLTRYSRTSLLTGALRDGSQADEKRLFPELAGGPVFHKDDLRSGAGHLLPQAVQEAVGSTSRTVAVVLNTVDDTLAKADPGGTDWTVESVQHLGALLDLAATHGRVVVLTSDHGHVVERGSQARAVEGAEARFRPAGSDTGADEVLLQGRRVLSSGGAVIAAVDEQLRYGRKAAGYHGGAAAAEVTVPVIVLAMNPMPLEALGWAAAPPQAPRWWYEEVADSTNAVAALVRPTKPVRVKQEETLFTPELAPPSAAEGAAVAAAVLTSAVYAGQRARAVRGGLDDTTVEAILAVLIDGGNRAHQDVVATAGGVPATRIGPTLAALRRMLNVDGYEVVSTDPDGVTVLLDRALLREQFGLGSR